MGAKDGHLLGVVGFGAFQGWRALLYPLGSYLRGRGRIFANAPRYLAVWLSCYIGEQVNAWHGMALIGADTLREE